MAGLCWGGVLICTGMGALFGWGARALAIEEFYREACLFLVTALICACLGKVLP